MDNTCCHTKKLRGEEEKRNLMNRLKRIEGQVRGLQNMLEQDAYCPDILIQVSAVTQALNSFNKELLGFLLVKEVTSGSGTWMPKRQTRSNLLCNTQTEKT